MGPVYESMGLDREQSSRSQFPETMSPDRGDYAYLQDQHPTTEAKRFLKEWGQIKTRTAESRSHCTVMDFAGLFWWIGVS
jgi:hypothetical protein